MDDDTDFHGAKGALFLGTRLLVTLRDDKPGLPHAAQWDFPGGGRDPDETPFQTLAREVREEVGLVLPEAAVLWRARLADAFRPGRHLWFFVARLPDAAAHDIAFGDEGQGWALMPPAAFLALPSAIGVLRDRLDAWMQAGAPTCN
ncbi:MAG: NUDIX domain-containing protein [Rhodobacterales bacterium]|nr:NUDIX domain-containing protein [Rhodobacterales bacterium]NCT13259.1 NUDIX domain-containing protein [Rhodobacterales bacterium]